MSNSEITPSIQDRQDRVRKIEASIREKFGNATLREFQSQVLAQAAVTHLLLSGAANKEGMWQLREIIAQTLYDALCPEKSEQPVVQGRSLEDANVAEAFLRAGGGIGNFPAGEGSEGSLDLGSSLKGEAKELYDRGCKLKDDLRGKYRNHPNTEVALVNIQLTAFINAALSRGLLTPVDILKRQNSELEDAISTGLFSEE